MVHIVSKFFGSYHFFCYLCSRFQERSTYLHTGIAQLVEHWSPKPGVGSSSLSSRANEKKVICFGISTYRLLSFFVSLMFLWISCEGLHTISTIS